MSAAVYSNLFTIHVQNEVVRLVFKDQRTDSEPIEEMQSVILARSNALALAKAIIDLDAHHSSLQQPKVTNA